MRRLFFSAIEHLRETAQRQADLNDEVAEEAGLNAEIAPEKAGPYGSRQKSLEQISNLVDSLKSNSKGHQEIASLGLAISKAVEFIRIEFSEALGGLEIQLDNELESINVQLNDLHI